MAPWTSKSRKKRSDGRPRREGRPEENAGLITPMLAACYALVNRARLKTGVRILLHSLTGGAGLSALQVALDRCRIRHNIWHKSK